MAWLREIGQEIRDTIVKSDNEPALTSLMEWNSPVGTSKSNGSVEKAGSGHDQNDSKFT